MHGYKRPINCTRTRTGMDVELDVDNQVHLVVPSSNSGPSSSSSSSSSSMFTRSAACAGATTAPQGSTDSSTGSRTRRTRNKKGKNWQCATDSKRPSRDGSLIRMSATNSKAHYVRACAAGTNSIKVELLQLTAAGCELTEVGAAITDK